MRYKSRKFWIAVGFVLLATVFFAMGKLSQALWVDLMKWIGGAYFFANAASKFASAKWPR